VTDETASTPLDALLGATPRRVTRHWLSLLLLALAGLGAAAFFVRFVTGEDSPYYSALVEQGDLTPLISERAELRVDGERLLSATQSGRVAWLTTKTSGPIRRGELLARIDAAAAKRAVGVERAASEASTASVAAAELAAQDAAGRLARFEGVWRRSGGRVPSLNEMERARAEAQRTQLALTAAKAQAGAARLRLADRKAALAAAEVRAPMNGVLVRRHVGEGQSVNERQPLFSIAPSTARLVVELPFAPALMRAMRTGAPARVRLDDLPEKVQEAKLLRVLTPPPAIAGPPLAQFVLTAPDAGARPGMSATVEMELPPRRNVLLVPDAALTFDPEVVPDRRFSRVYVLPEDGEPRRVVVAAGAGDGKRTEVFGLGLVPGDHVITGWRRPAAHPGQSAK